VEEVLNAKLYISRQCLSLFTSKEIFTWMCITLQLWERSNLYPSKFIWVSCASVVTRLIFWQRLIFRWECFQAISQTVNWHL